MTEPRELSAPTGQSEGERVKDAVRDGGRQRRSGTWPNGVRWAAYPFCLRPNVIATVEIPFDLTIAEAERLAAFIATLALPTNATPETHQSESNR